MHRTGNPLDDEAFDWLALTPYAKVSVSGRFRFQDPDEALTCELLTGFEGTTSHAAVTLYPRAAWLALGWHEYADAFDLLDAAAQAIGDPTCDAVEADRFARALNSAIGCMRIHHMEMVGLDVDAPFRSFAILDLDDDLQDGWALVRMRKQTCLAEWDDDRTIIEVLLPTQGLSVSACLDGDSREHERRLLRALCDDLGASTDDLIGATQKSSAAAVLAVCHPNAGPLVARHVLDNVAFPLARQAATLALLGGLQSD